MKCIEGIFDRLSFPETLRAFVVEPSADPRLHGYAVQADLGHNAGFVDVAWLALTGELPTPDEREALNRALVWLAPLHVGEGPTHAAVLARVAGAPDEVLPAIATVALGQRVAGELQGLSGFFEWLADSSGLLPEGIAEPSPTEPQCAGWARLCADTVRWFGPARAFSGPVWRREPAAWALLHRLGVRDMPRLQALATLARLPVLLAEAACTPRGSVMRYPTKTPAYLYVEGS